MSDKFALISLCGTYRYLLSRRIPQPIRWVKPCLFVMLNPSIADADIDDPTIRRCIGFAKREGCTSMTVVNLFALRATDPKKIRLHADPCGPDNFEHLTAQIQAHNIGVIIAAWGADPFTKQPWFPTLADGLRKHNAKCLGMTKDGSPRHPLYIKGDQPLITWTG